MFVGLDLGTTNVKALLVTQKGRVLARASFAVQLQRGSSGAVEQDLEEICTAAFNALKQIGQHPEAASVQALGISSQGGALQLIDSAGAATGPVISWLDARGQRYDEALTRELGKVWFAQHIGHGTSAVAAGQLRRLRQEQPSLLAADKRVCFVGECVAARLCGAFAQDATSLSIAALLNPALAQPDAELLEKLGLAVEQLQPPAPVRCPAGSLKEQIARLTGLPAGIPVSCAVHDQYAAAMGCAAVDNGDVMFGAGTAWVLLATVERLVGPVIDEAFVSPHVVEGRYGQLLSLGNGGSAISWALDALGVSSVERQNLDALLASVHAGSDGVRVWPHLAGGAAAGLPSASAGRIEGLRLAHTRAHLLRGVIEGLACELARHLSFFKHLDLKVTRLVMCGGAAESTVTPQIIADVTGLPIACTHEPEMSALGAAMIARGLVEPNSSLQMLAQSMTSPVRIVTPGEDFQLYGRMFQAYLQSVDSSGH